MCLLHPSASQARRHELHMSPIYGDMKQPMVNRDSRLPQTMLMTLTFIRIIVCFS